MYKFDSRVWNHRVRKTVIVSLIAPLFSGILGVTAPIANAVLVTAGDGSCIQDVGSATGITVTKVGSDCLVTFSAPSNTTTSHRWTVPSNGTSYQILVVGGGGGGGPDGGNGGGGGELRYGSVASAWVPAAGTELTLQVGAGGVGGSHTPSSGSAAGILSRVSWGGSARFTANPGGGGGGWTSGDVALGGTGGSGGSGTAGQSATALQSGCGNLSATQNNTSGKWYTGLWFLNGGSGAGTALTTTAPSNPITGSDKFYGGAGGGGWGGNVNSASIGPIYGLAGGGTVDNVSTSGGRGSNWRYIPGDNHTTSWNGASAGAQGVDATGGGGGGGNACDPTINGAATTNGSTRRTAGGRGGSGVIVIRYTPVLFTVTFNANGGSGSPSTSSASQIATSNSVTLASVGTLARSGFRFEGWNTAANGTGTNYSAGSTFTPGSNLTLYAQWNSTINYNGNTSTSTRTIESTSAVSSEANLTLSTGRLIRGTPISSGLVLSLDASDSTTVSAASWTNKVAGVSGAEASATIVGSPTYNSTDGYFALNGSSQYFTLGSTNYYYNGTKNFSLSICYSPSDTNKASAIMSRYNGNVAGTYLFQQSSDYLYGFREVSPWQTPAGTKLVSGENYCVSETYDGSYLRVYLNGNLDATSALMTGSVYDSSITAAIGAAYDNNAASRFLKGKIYNAQIYNRALSAAEIATNYQSMAPGQLVTKTNYTLGAWNTQSNASGTSYGTVSTDLAALPTPYFRVSAENYSGGTLSASVGGSNLAITKTGSPVLNSNSGGGFGANARFSTISGATGDGFRLGNAELPNYTFCGMARYKDLDSGVTSTRGRIFANGSGTNWLSGWYDRGTKNFYHDAWMLGAYTVADPKWHVVCDSGNQIYWDGVKQTVTNATYTRLPPLAINWGAYGDNSHFEFTEAIVYDQALTSAQINNIFRYFKNKFGLTDVVTSSQSAATFVPPTNFASSGDATLQATWVSQVTYDGNKQTSGTAPSPQTVTNSGGTVASVGTLLRSGYRFAGWNTAANGSGTAYPVGAALTNDGNKLLYAQWVLPVALPVAFTNPSSLSPYMRLVASDYDAANKIWRDSSGNSRNVTRIAGAPTVSTVTGNGASKSFQTVAGGTSDKIYIDNDPILTNWTVFALSRYSSAIYRNRIISGNYAGGSCQPSTSNCNWLIGQYGGKAAVAHFNGWVSPDSTPSGQSLSDWVMSTGYPSNYRYNGTPRGTSGGTSELPPLGINTYSGEVSDFQIAEIIIFDRTLTASEIGQVEDYFDETYGLVYSKVGTYKTASTMAIAATVGGRSDTFTATDGYGNKTFGISPTVSGITLDTATANGVAIVVGLLVPVGVYVETITATDQAGYTSQHVVTITVSEQIKWSASNATTLTTTVGTATSARMNVTGGMSGKIATITKPTSVPLGGITIDTSTLTSSSYVTLNVSSAVLPGTYSVTLSVTDDTKRVSNQVISLVINNLPSLSYTLGSNDTTTTVIKNGLWLQYEIGKSWSGSGTSVVDLTGNNVAGSIVANSPYSASLGGGSVALDGTKYIWLNTGVIQATDSLSKFYWIYPTAATGAIVRVCQVGCDYHESEFEMLNGKLYARVWNLSSVASSETITTNAWHYVGYIYDRTAGTTSIYIDGRLSGSIANSGTRGPPSTTQYDGISLGDTTNMVTGTNGQFSFGAAHYYKRALSASEVFSNFAATAPRYFGTTFPGLDLSGTASITTTQGVASSYSLFTASAGTGNKILTLSPTVSGISLDTSTANLAILNLANTLTSTNSTTAKVISTSVRATDSVTAITDYSLSITVNPQITITPTIANTVTTTFGVTAYDTFTAAYGTGTLTFSNTASSNQSAFTLTKPSLNVGLLTIANNLPIGTYTDTITVTDSVSAVTNYVLTVVVNPRITISAATSATVSTTVGRPASTRINIINGTGVRTLSYTSPNAGITIDSSTITSNYATLNVSASVPTNTYTMAVTARDSLGVTSVETFSVVVNKWPRIANPVVVAGDLRLHLDAGNSGSYSGSGATWTDLSGNSRNGTLQSTPSYSSASGGILSFNGSSQYVTAPSVRSELFTVEAWVKFNALNNDYACVITNVYNGDKINYSICFRGNSTIAAGYHQAVTGWVGGLTGTFTPVVGTWYQLVYKVEKVGANYIGSLYQNGNLVSGQTTSTIAPNNDQLVDRIGRRWDSAEYINGSIPIVRIYSRALSDSEIIQNYNAQGFKFFATNSGTDSATVTQGIAGVIGSVTASEGSGTKTFAISNVNSGITIDTSIPNSYTLNLANTLTATNSTTARTLTETVTATDAASATTTRVYTITVNPPVQETFTAASVTTTSGIVAYDTFTATYGTGNKTFTLTGSPTTSGFTLTQANNVAVLKVEATANPGTYYETVTATDTLGATKSLMITVVVYPPPTLIGSNNLVSARGIAFTSPAFSVVNGIAPYTYTLTSKALIPDTNTVTGITFDTATMTLRVATSVAAGTYAETITVRDSKGASSNYLVALEVKPPVVLSGSLSVTKTYGDLTVSNYTTSSGIAPFTFTTSTSAVSNVCAPITGTYIGDGTNGTLGVSYTYEKITGTDRCNWIAPLGVTSVDYAVVGGGGGGGNGRGGGGGGGGVATGTGLSISAGSVYDIAVAAGGAATVDGNDSWVRNADGSVTYIYAAGGGAGGSMADNLELISGNSGKSVSPSGRTAGGSGGGGGNNFYSTAAWTGISGVGGTGAVAGFAGGGSYRCSTSINTQDGNTSVGGNGGRTTGGGGGAGGVGNGYSGSCPTYLAAQAPNGGTGVVSRLTGSVETYGGGGGGADGRTEVASEASYRSSGRGLGNGGGGNGQSYRQPDGTLLGTPQAATSGDYNTGGGGGGGITAAGNGGSGVVVLRYVTPSVDSQTVKMFTVSNGVSTTGSVTLTIPENTPAGSITSKTIRVVQTGGVTTDYTINVTINKATPTVALSLPGAVTTAQYGNPVTISAVASTAGNIAFKNAATNITACTAVATSSGIATCSWTPTAIGATTLKATLTPTDTTNYNNSNETTFNVTVGRADTLTVTASNEALTYTGATALVTRLFTTSGLVSIDSLTAVSMIYSGTANDGTNYLSSTAPTLAGTYTATPDTTTAGISTVAGNYLGVTAVPGTFTLNRARNTSSLVYPTVNTNSAVTSPPANNYITFKTGITDTPTTKSRLGNGVITYSSITPVTCSVDSSTAVMSLIQAGSCQIRMTVDQGSNYLSDSATATIEIAKGNRTISISSATSTLKYFETATATTTISDGSLDGNITYSLNASPGCSFDALGGILTATSGTLACTLNATVAEGTNFLTASTASALPLTIAKAIAPVITMDTVTAVSYVPGQRASIVPTYRFTGFKGTDAASSVTLTYSFVSNPFGTFSYSETQTPVGAGTYRITPSNIVMSSGLATNYETPNYAASAITFTINRINQDPVTIDGINGEVDVPYTLVYRGGNNPNVPATFTKVSGAACTVSGSSLSATEAGICVVRVTVPANLNYLEITSDSITVRVRNYVFIPVFTFGNGTTGISVSSSTTLKKDEDSCTTGCVPTLTLSTPYEGAEGDVVTLTGTFFTGARRVIFNVFTDATSFSVDSDTTISVQVPAGLTPGDGTIEVVTARGTTPRYFDFTVLP